MKLLIKNTIETEIEIPVPCFWIDKSVITGNPVEWAGLLDEKTLVIFYSAGSYISMRNQEPDNSKMAELHTKYELSTEAEFFEAFERVYKSINVMPVAVSDGEYDNIQAGNP